MKTKHTMESLRKEGYKVRCTHFRYTQHGLFSNLQIRKENAGEIGPRDDSPRKHVISPMGGKVVVKIRTPDGANEVEGESNCSLKDNFMRKVGTGIAFGRALHGLKILNPEGPRGE